MRFSDYFPDANALLALEPEELAGVLLEYLLSLGWDNQSQLNRYNFGLPHSVQSYPEELGLKAREALIEAWVWLEREGLLAPKPGTDSNTVFVTRRGHALKNRSGVEAYRRSNLLPKELLHVSIGSKVWATFLRGDYDTAVFQAFKEVEVAVRDAGGLQHDDIGTGLMRKAFGADSGPLTDPTAPSAEREALGHLFAGAIGSYKNPHSHRKVPIEPREAVEMIILASHLLGIVDSRRSLGG